MDKKGDLSINIIIIAAIALIILVIISVLLFRSGGDLQRGTSCEGVGGVCIDTQLDAASCRDYAEYVLYTDQSYTRHVASCPNRGEICCMPVGR